MSWKDFIISESEKDYYKTLSDFVVADAKENFVFPKHENVFNAFKLCPLKKVKVVILGQDPYHGPDQAHGLSFSVQDNIAIPPSLKNIFAEIKSDLNSEKVFANGNLTSWAKQGVLLLNTILTVRKGEPLAHRGKGWEQFTDAAISLVSKQDRPIVYLLWGATARAKKKLITSSVQHLVLEAPHPSPLSAHTGFLGCHHFSKTNDFLINNEQSPINWESVTT